MNTTATQRLQVLNTCLLPEDDYSVNEEDGERYYYRVWRLGVTTYDGRQWIHPETDRNKDFMAHFAGRVLVQGDIDPERWMEIPKKDPNDLPDYVTDPYRPEFN